MLAVAVSMAFWPVPKMYGYPVAFGLAAGALTTFAISLNSDVITARHRHAREVTSRTTQGLR